MIKNISLKKYIGIFTATNLGMAVAVALVLELLGTDGNVGVNIGILIGSAMAAGHYFIKDHHRLPTTAEKAALILFSFLASTLVTLVFIGVIAILEPTGVTQVWMLLQEHTFVFLMIMASAMIICLIVLWMGYGFLLKQQFRSMQKKGVL